MDRTKDVPEVTRTEQSIAFYLDSKLEQFSNGRTYGSDPSNKTNGYHAAKVPDWQLRRWADETNALTAEIADLRAQLDEAMEGLDKIYTYCNDTLSGRVGGPDDREWQRGAVTHARNVAREFARPELHRDISEKAALSKPEVSK